MISAFLTILLKGSSGQTVSPALDAGEISVDTSMSAVLFGDLYYVNSCDIIMNSKHIAFNCKDDKYLAVTTTRTFLAQLYNPEPTFRVRPQLTLQ